MGTNLVAAAAEKPPTFWALFLALRGRLVLLVGLATMPAILLAVFVSTNERRATVERLEMEARLVAHLASREHRHLLEGAKGLLLRIGPLLDRDEPAASNRRDALQALQRSAPQFANIGVLSPRGDLVSSAVAAPRSLNMASLPVFGQALRSREVEIGTYAIGPIVNRPVLHMAYALRDADGRPREVAFIALELSWLDELASQAALPPDYSLLICDRDGVVLAGSGYLPPPSGAREPAAPLLARVLHQQGGVVLGIGSPAVARFFVATRLDGLPDLSVIAGLPYDRVQSEANGSFYRMLAALALVTGLTLASALLAAELSVLRTLRTLTRAARRLGAGDLSSRATLTGGRGELQELAVSFNRMADALERRQREADEAQTQLRALSHRLQATRDDEAGRIARELHDELGQVLTGLKIELARVRRVCSGTPLPACASELVRDAVEMGARIDGAIDFVRRIASELRPSVLDRLGLPAALEWLAHEFEAKTGLPVSLRVAELTDPPEGPVALALFRIVQEALTNVARHAAARAVRIDLVTGGDTLVLTIQDDGCGIDPTRMDGRDSLGILNMKERAHLAGGAWRLHGAPGEGTTIVVEIPIRPVIAVKEG